MEEFEQMWGNVVEDCDTQHVPEDTPEYLIRDGIARVKILADMLINYYHAKYGEPIQESTKSFEIKFHL